MFQYVAMISSISNNLHNLLISLAMATLLFPSPSIHNFSIPLIVAKDAMFVLQLFAAAVNSQQNPWL